MTPGDKETFEQDLQQTEAAYRQSGLDEPPDLLNQAILNRAKHAIDKPAARPWSFGWIHATATAALVVLGLGLVYQQRDERGNVPGALDQLQPAAPVSSGAALQDAAKYRENATSEIFNTAEERRAVVAKAAAESEIEQPDAAQVSRQIVSELDGPNLNAQELPKQKPLEETADQVFAAPPMRAGNATEEAGRRKRDQARSGDVKSEPEAAFSAPGETMGKTERPVAGSESDELLHAGTDEIRVDKREAERAPVSAPSVAAPAVGQVSQQPMEQKDLDSAKRAGDDRQETQVDPEQWLQDIRKLKAADPEGEWRSELDAFKEIYPDYPVPGDLLDPAETPKPPEPE